MSNIRRFGLTLCLLALAAFAAGCGMDQSPVAQEEATVTQTTDAPNYIVLGSPRLAKTTGNRHTETTSGTFYPDRWGSLQVDDW